MANEQMGLLGQKIGMTQLYKEDGEVQACTVVQVGPCRVLQVKTDAKADGYNALQLGYGTQKAHRITKAQAGHYAASESAPARIVRELRVSKDAAEQYTAGQDVSAADVFVVGQHADVIGISKGRGFSGVMRRHNFKGFIRSHGTHEFFRHGGSIGTRLTPGMVAKGKKMPGQMGNKQVTVQNLEIVKVDAERNLVFLRGGVPGPKGAFVKVRQAVKKG